MTKTIDTLKALDAAYFNGEATVPDSVYDQLKDEVKALFPNDPYFTTVGAAPASHLDPVPLNMHMGSQQKILFEDLQGWCEEVATGDSVLVMEKLDGSSVEATYLDGKLVRVATRGDGITGSDITRNAALWKGLPKSIASSDGSAPSGMFVVRGEALMDIDVWKENFPEDSNPRNTANGIVMRKSDEEGDNSKIRMIAFDCSHQSAPDRIDSMLLMLSDYGFDVVPCMVARNLGEVVGAFRLYEAKARAALPYEIDGLILSVPTRSRIAELGYKDGGTRPRGQAALKFKAASGVTTVKAITLTIGHTGAIIPTAELEPVAVGGVVISNVLLNNQEFIRDLGVNVGDRVVVERAGDVIPYLRSVVEKIGDGYFRYPSDCPFCGSLLASQGRAIVCVNKQCHGRSFQMVKNWVKKLEIKQLGETLLRSLYDSGKVRTIPDLYRISIDDLATAKSGNGVLGRSLASRVMQEIDRTRMVDTNTFMGSVSVTFLGRSMAAHIGLAHPLDYFKIPLGELATKENMGVNKASMMLDSLMERQQLITELLSVVVIKEQLGGKEPVTGGRLSGMAAVFTGVRPTKEERELFESLGGVIKDSVSKNATHLIQKSSSSESSKTAKARSLGLTILGYDDFLNLLK